MTEDTIAVALRVRPIIKRENKLANTNVWDIVGNEISLNDASGVFVNREIFTFDYIFDQSATNKELFELVHPLVLSSIEGYNATVFAYGQTSSGKTHSILGTDTDPGIIPLAAHDIFNCIRERSQESEEIYTVRLSYVEIYNEKINDLLDLNNKDIKIRENNSGNVFIQCHEDIVGNEAAMIKTINIGSKNRQIGETRMNERSSRSHVICDITIESRERIENEEILEQNDYPVKVGHLYIVDLAGSERISQTRATGQRLNEGVHINKSLLNLIKVITQLSTGNIFISFRDSKLTRLLTNSLGGNCRTLIIATITPVSVDDSLSTLKFARRAKLIKNKPRVNEVNTSDSYIGKFYALQKKMNKVLAERNGAMEMLEDKDEVIKNLKKQLLPYSNMFVTSNDPERPPKPSRRRHTMGSLKADEKHMETICEQWEPSVSKEHENFKKKIVEILPENKFEKATSSTFDADQYQDLRMQYDQLDQSHAELKEFTKTQMNVEVEERTVELQKEVSRLTQLLSEREQYAADLDFSHATLREFTRLEEDIVVKERTRLLQLQEELSILKKRNIRLEEIDVVSQSQQHQLQRRCSELLSRIEELEAEKIRLLNTSTNSDNVIAKTDKREFSARLTEMHSKFFLDEFIPKEIVRPLSLQRSLSESHLLSLRGNIHDAAKKEEFQNIDKSLWQLTSIIISDNEKNGHLRITEKISTTEENECLISARKENAILKESTNELLLKLKALTDKFNASQIQYDVNLAQYQEKIKSLEDEVAEFSNHSVTKLQGQQTSSEYQVQQGNIKIEEDDSINIEEIKIQMPLLQEKSEEYELISKNLQDSHQKIEELTSELNLYKNKSDCLPNQNSKFITELQEKLKLGNEFQKEKEMYIKELEEKIKSFDEVIKLKAFEMEELQEKFKQKAHEHEMDRTALEYTTTDLEEAAAKIKELLITRQQTIIEHTENMEMLTQELQMYKSNSTDKLEVRIDELQKELHLAQESLKLKEISRSELENKLKETENKLTGEQPNLMNFAGDNLKVKNVELQKDLKFPLENHTLKEVLSELENKLKQCEDKLTEEHSYNNYSDHDLKGIIYELQRKLIIAQETFKIGELFTLELENKLKESEEKHITDTKTLLQQEQKLDEMLKEIEALDEQMKNNSTFAEETINQMKDILQQKENLVKELEEKVLILEQQSVEQARTKISNQDHKHLNVDSQEHEVELKLNTHLLTLERKELELQELEKLVKLNEERNKAGERTLDEKSTQLRELLSKITDLEKRLDNHKQSLVQSDEKILELNKALSQKERLNKELEVKLIDNDSKAAKIDELISKINVYEKEAEATSLNNLEAMNELHQLLKEKETIVQKLEHKLEETSQKLILNAQQHQYFDSQLQLIKEDHKRDLQEVAAKYTQEKFKFWQEKEEACKNLIENRQKDADQLRITTESLKEKELQLQEITENLKESEHKRKIDKGILSQTISEYEDALNQVNTLREQVKMADCKHQEHIAKSTKQLVMSKGQSVDKEMQTDEDTEAQELSYTLSQLKNELKQEKDEHISIVEAYKQLQNDYKESIAQLDQLKEELNQRNIQAQTSQQELYEQKEQFRLRKDVYEKLKMDYDQATDKINHLNEEIELKKEHVSKLEEILHKKQQEEKVEKTEMNELRATQDQLQEQFTTAQKSIKKLESQLKKETTDLLIYKAAFESSEKKYNYAIEEVKELQEEIAKNDNIPLQQQLKLANKKLDDHKDQLKQVQDELHVEKSMHTADKDALEQLQRKYETAQIQIEDLHAEIVRNKGEISRLYDDILKVEKERAEDDRNLRKPVIESKESGMQGLEHDLNEEKQKLILANNQLVQFKAKYENAQRSYDDIKKSYDEIKKSYDEILKTLEDDTNNYTTLKGNYEEVNRRYKEALDQFEITNKENSKNRLEVSRLMQELQAKHETDNRTTIECHQTLSQTMEANEKIKPVIKVCNLQVPKAVPRTTKNVSFQIESAESENNLKDMELKELETLLQKKRYAHTLDREALRVLTQDHQEVTKKLKTSQDELSTIHADHNLKVAQLTKDSSLLKLKLTYIKELETTVNQMRIKHTQDSETLKKVLADRNEAVNKIQELETLVTNSKDTEKELEALQHKYDQIMLNNKNALNIDSPLVQNLQSEIHMLQSLHAKQIECMKENCDKKCEDYRKKYDETKVKLETLVKSKEDSIVELRHSLVSLRRQTEAEAQHASKKLQDAMNKIQLLNQDDTRMLERSKLKIADMAIQLQAVKSQSAIKISTMEKERQKLMDDHTAEILRMNEKLKAAEEQISNDVVIISKKRQKIAMQVDAELCAVPQKLFIIEKICSLKVNGSLCPNCNTINECLIRLLDNCAKLPAWEQFGVLTEQAIGKTELFHILIETSNILMNLLSSVPERSARASIRQNISNYNKLIDDYVDILKAKKDCLSKVHENLQKCKSELSSDSFTITTCRHCELFKCCGVVVLTLTEHIHYTNIMLETITNGLEPLEYTVTHIKICNGRLDELMSNVKELNSSELRYKADLEAMMQKYRKVKKLAELRYEDVQLMTQVLYEENYSINFKVNPIQIVKNSPFSQNASCATFGEDDNPRPVAVRPRDTGRKSIGATPKHFSPFFVTPDEHKIAKHEARRHK